MKKLKFLFYFLTLGLILLGNTGYSQGLKDTIVTLQNEFIIGKVTKITDIDIEYKKEIDLDAIIYVISKSKVREIRLGNGKIESILPDIMDEHPEGAIIDKRSAIKFHFFSLFFDHIALTYEKSLKMGLNLETTFGFINNSMMNFSVIDKSKLIQGATIVFGPKFILGHSFYIKGMKYSHPLKGGYFKPEIILTSFTVRGIQYSVYNNYYNKNTYQTDLRVNCASLLLTMGSQYIIANSFTIGFNLGVGYSFLSTKYTNPDVSKLMSLNNSYNYYYNENPSEYTTYLFNQARFSNEFPLTLTSSITLGYIFK